MYLGTYNFINRKIELGEVINMLNLKKLMSGTGLVLMLMFGFGGNGNNGNGNGNVRLPVPQPAFTPAQDPPTNTMTWATNLVDTIVTTSSNNNALDLSATIPVSTTAVVLKGYVEFAGGGQPTMSDANFIIAPMSGAGTIHQISQISGNDGNWKDTNAFWITLPVDPATRTVYWSWRNNGFDNNPQFRIRIDLVGWIQ
jgi:hypothetical protein